MRVLAVVVTYNRARELLRCIDYIQAQSRQPNGLLVINNGSSDDTVARLKERNVDQITQANLGSAGGWHRGIEYALANGYDAVWMMDDDGYPDQEALSKLVPALDEGVACVSSVVLREDMPTHFVFPFPILDKAGLPVTIARRRKINTLEELHATSRQGRYPFAHLFNGALISCRVIRAIGNVQTGYFMFGDDVDYFMRLRGAGTVISLLSAHHIHPNVAGRPLTDIKLYYYIKNTIILNQMYFNQVRLRNLLSVLAGLGRMALRNGIGSAFDFSFGTKAWITWRAVRRGKRGQIGMDFDA